MGFNKSVESRKAVLVEYWRIASFEYSQSGNLYMRVAGYKDGESYSKGAEPIDTYEISIFNADPSIKEQFYELIESSVGFFKGAEKELSYSAKRAGGQSVSVATSRGETVMRSEPAEPEPEQLALLEEARLPERSETEQDEEPCE